nr:hypothetical protein [Tanacetum cinerariifolium]
MADLNAPSGQTPAMEPPLHADDQILPHIRWVPIGKSNCYLDMEKLQSNPIYKIAVDLLKNTNFFRAFTASSTIPSIYIQQFWDTILYDKKAGCYRCQLDEQWEKESHSDCDSKHSVHQDDYPSSSEEAQKFNRLHTTRNIWQRWLSIEAKPQEKKRKQATETSDKPPKEKKSKHGWVSKKHSRKNVEASKTEEVPTVEPQVADEDAEYQKVLKESMKDAYALPRGTLPTVVIREPKLGKYQPFPEVPGKGKAKVTEEQVSHDLLSLQKHKKTRPADQYIFQKRVSKPTGSSRHDESPYALIGQLDGKEESEKVMLGAEEGGQDEGQARPVPDAQAEDQTGSDIGAQAEDQTGSDAGAQAEGQAGSNPDETFEGQAEPDPGDAEAKVQSISSLVVHARSDREHMDLDGAKRIGELEHIMANMIQVNKEMEERLDKHGARLFTLEQLDIPQQVSIACMWESESYKSHEDHMQLFEALEKSMNSDHSEELAQDLAEVRKKKKKSRESPKTPPGSPSHQPPPPPPPAGLSKALRAPGASGLAQVPPSPPPPSSTNQESPSKGSAAPSPSKTATSAEYQAWTTTDIRLRPQGWWKPFEEERPATSEPAWSIRSSDMPVPTNNWASALASNYSPPPEDSLLAQTDDMATFIDWFCKRRGITELKPQDLEGLTFEIIKVFHPDVIHLQYQMEECHKLLTDSVDNPILRNNISKPLPLGGPPGDHYIVRTHMRILSVVRIKVFSMYGYDYMKKIGLLRADLNEHVIAEQDFKYLYPSDFKDLYILNLQAYLNHLPPKDKKILTTIVNQWTRQLVIRQRVEDFQLGIESYQTQVNLTKPRWTATGFEYKHDYTVIESPRAVIFWDKYGVQMMIRFNEIHKFSNGTLQQIDEALDYMVKEFRINRMNPGRDNGSISCPYNLSFLHDVANRFNTFLEMPK